jgi:hypothetical protein
LSPSVKIGVFNLKDKVAVLRISTCNGSLDDWQRDCEYSGNNINEVVEAIQYYFDNREQILFNQVFNIIRNL